MSVTFSTDIQHAGTRDRESGVVRGALVAFATGTSRFGSTGGIVLGQTRGRGSRSRGQRRRSTSGSLASIEISTESLPTS